MDCGKKTIPVAYVIMSIAQSVYFGPSPRAVERSSALPMWERLRLHARRFSPLPAPLNKTGGALSSSPLATRGATLTLSLSHFNSCAALSSLSLSLSLSLSHTHTLTHTHSLSFFLPLAACCCSWLRSCGSAVALLLKVALRLPLLRRRSSRLTADSLRAPSLLRPAARSRSFLEFPTLARLLGRDDGSRRRG